MELNPAFATNSDKFARAAGDEDEHETQAKVTKPPATVVDKSGDVILTLGDASLLVSSKVLSVASPVFRAMFGPHFQEGNMLSKRYGHEFRAFRIINSAQV
jgi:hypothetical protein